jgi:hypothetical protein
VPFLGFCVLVFAVLLIVGTIRDAVTTSRVRRHGVTTTADVVGVNTYIGQASVTHSRVVRFATDGGGEVIATMPRGQLRGIPVGGRAEIRYLPEKPKVTRASNGGARYLSSLFAIAVVVVLGVAMLVS